MSTKPKEDRKICENCKWVDREADKESLDYQNHPNLYPFICRNNSPNENGWPGVRWDDWCGEFERKERN